MSNLLFLEKHQNLKLSSAANYGLIGYTLMKDSIQETCIMGNNTAEVVEYIKFCTTQKKSYSIEILCLMVVYQSNAIFANLLTNEFDKSTSHMYIMF